MCSVSMLVAATCRLNQHHSADHRMTLFSPHLSFMHLLRALHPKTPWQQLHEVSWGEGGGCRQSQGLVPNLELMAMPHAMRGLLHEVDDSHQAVHWQFGLHVHVVFVLLTCAQRCSGAHCNLTLSIRIHCSHAHPVLCNDAGGAANGAAAL